MSYDPAEGRWMQTDSLDYIDGANLYQAFGSGPLVNLDPQGTNISDTGNRPTGGLGGHSGIRVDVHDPETGKVIGVLDVDYGAAGYMGPGGGGGGSCDNSCGKGGGNGGGNVITGTPGLLVVTFIPNKSVSGDGTSNTSAGDEAVINEIIYQLGDPAMPGDKPPLLKLLESGRVTMIKVRPKNGSTYTAIPGGNCHAYSDYLKDIHKRAEDDQKARPPPTPPTSRPSVTK